MQDDGYDPDLDEMETTTQRNRGMRNAPPGPVAPKKSRKSQAFPQMHEEQPDEGDSPFKGQAPIKKKSSPQDKGKGGSHGIAIIISPMMSNPVQEHRDSIRNSIGKSINQLKRKR